MGCHRFLKALVLLNKVEEVKARTVVLHDHLSKLGRRAENGIAH
jgi:hypothetical protein